MLNLLKSRMLQHHLSTCSQYHITQLDLLNQSSVSDESYYLQLIWMVKHQNTTAVAQWLNSQPAFTAGPPPQIQQVLITLNTVSNENLSPDIIASLSNWKQVFDTLSTLMQKVPHSWYAYHEQKQFIRDDTLRALVFHKTLKSKADLSFGTYMFFGIIISSIIAVRLVFNMIHLHLLNGQGAWLFGHTTLSYVIGGVLGLLFGILGTALWYAAKSQTPKTVAHVKPSLKSWYLSWNDRLSALKATHYQLSLDHADYVELAVWAILLHAAQVPKSAPLYEQWQKSR